MEGERKPDEAETPDDPLSENESLKTLVVTKVKVASKASEIRKKIKELLSLKWQMTVQAHLIPNQSGTTKEQGIVKRAPLVVEPEEAELDIQKYIRELEDEIKGIKLAQEIDIEPKLNKELYIPRGVREVELDFEF